MIRDLSLFEKDLFGLFDLSEKDVIQYASYDLKEVVKAAIEMAKEDGIWNDLKANKEAKVIIRNLKETYPDIFEDE